MFFAIVTTRFSRPLTVDVEAEVQVSGGTFHTIYVSFTLHDDSHLQVGNPVFVSQDEAFVRQFVATGKASDANGRDFTINQGRGSSRFELTKLAVVKCEWMLPGSVWKQA